MRPQPPFAGGGLSSPASCSSGGGGGAGQPPGALLVAASLALTYALAFAIRLFSVLRFENMIHEYDPYFNLRATELLEAEGWGAFRDWFDGKSWYPLGREAGATVGARPPGLPLPPTCSPPRPPLASHLLACPALPAPEEGEGGGGGCSGSRGSLAPRAPADWALSSASAMPTASGSKPTSVDQEVPDISENRGRART